MTHENDRRDSEDGHDTSFDTPLDDLTRSVVVTSDGLGSATGEIEQETRMDRVQSALLVVEDGPDAGQDFEVRGSAHVGRARDNDVILVDAGVGRSHLLITSDHGMWRMQDLQSANGTRLNGSYVTGSTPIFHGDLIAIGRTSLRFETTNGSFAERTAAGTAPDALDSLSLGAPVNQDVVGRSGSLAMPRALLGTPAPIRREPAIARRPTLVDDSATRRADSDLRYSARILLFAGGWAAAVVLLALVIRLLR